MSPARLCLFAPAAAAVVFAVSFGSIAGIQDSLIAHGFGLYTSILTSFTVGLPLGGLVLACAVHRVAFDRWPWERRP